MGTVDLGLFKMIDTKYQSGIAIDNYNGRISLQNARSKESGIWVDWAHPQGFEDGEKIIRDKAVPMAVTIGNSKQQAIETLEHFIDILKNGPKKNIDGYEPPPADDESDIPF